MSDDVLITPASRKIEFKDSSGNVDGKIELDSSGNLKITSPGGGLELGDAASDIFVGNGTANIDIIFEQNGEIRGTTGRTVTLGQSDSNITVDALNFTTSTSTLFKSQSGITSNRIATDTNAGSSATNISSFTAPHTLVGINNANTQYALLATLPATTTGTLDHVNIEGTMGGYTNNQNFKIKFKRRDSFGYEYTLFAASPVLNRAAIVAYQASNGTVTIHAKLTASTYGKLTYTITDAYQATVVDKPSLTTSTPAGTLIFDSNDTSTYPPTMKFPDNQKLEFGAAADLRIYHDGSNSIIEDNGTGSLQLKGAVNINGAYTLPAADGNSSQVLATNGSGTISFQSVGSLSGSGIQNVSDDTSPQLGGNLATAANNIQFGDSSGSSDDRLQFGASQDLQIYHDGSNSFIADGGTGDLVIQATHLRLRSAGAETYFLGTADGSVELYHDNTKKFETSSAGATVTGALTVTGNLAVNGGQIIAEDGFVGFGDSSADNWGKIEYLSSDPTGFTSQYTNAVAVDNEQGSTNQQIYIFDTSAGNDADLFGIAASGAAILSVTGQGDIKFKRPNANTSYDITLATPTPTANRTITLPDATGTILVNAGNQTLTGDLTFPDDEKAVFGTGSDLTISHESSGNHSVIRESGTGNLYIDASNLYLRASQSDSFDALASFTANGAAELYHNNSKKLATTSEGIQVTDTGAGSLAVLELGTTSTTEQGMIRLNGSTANKYSTMYTSNGNLHIDSAGTSSYRIYLNWYTSDGNSTTGGTIFGNGNGGQAAKIDGSGNLTLGGSITFSDGSVQTAAGSTEGFSIAMATALG